MATHKVTLYYYNNDGDFCPVVMANSNYLDMKITFSFDKKTRHWKQTDNMKIDGFNDNNGERLLKKLNNAKYDGVCILNTLNKTIYPALPHDDWLIEMSFNNLSLNIGSTIGLYCAYNKQIYVGILLDFIHKQRNKNAFYYNAAEPYELHLILDSYENSIVVNPCEDYYFVV